MSRNFYKEWVTDVWKIAHLWHSKFKMVLVILQNLLWPVMALAITGKNYLAAIVNTRQSRHTHARTHTHTQIDSGLCLAAWPSALVILHFTNDVKCVNNRIIPKIMLILIFIRCWAPIKMTYSIVDLIAIQFVSLSWAFMVALFRHLDLTHKIITDKKEHGTCTFLKHIQYAS